MPEVGFEPTSLATHGPKPCAYASSATQAPKTNNPLYSGYDSNFFIKYQPLAFFFAAYHSFFLSSDHLIDKSFEIVNRDKTIGRFALSVNNIYSQKLAL